MLKKIIPQFIIKIYADFKGRKYLNMSRKETFSTIYKDNVWGGDIGEFVSGSGTLNPNTSIYVKNVSEFIEKNNVKTMLDIGCGDFRVGRQICKENPTLVYTGADIVDSLIDYNKQHFSSNNIKFRVLDAVDDALPAADLCTIRQVWQHLSNDEIVKIIPKLSIFKYLIITEHLPIGDNIFINLDKNHGPDIRMLKKSGVFIDKPPFNMANTKVLFEYREDFKVFGKIQPALIRTYMVNNQGAAVI